METLKGVLVFHSETGTEGGHWAFQDEKFMNIANKDRRCTRCGRVWMSWQTDEPKPSFTYWRHDPRPNYLDGYFACDEPQDLPLARDDSETFNIAYTKSSNDRALACYTNGHEGWELMYPKGMWSYAGLHTLGDGDHLTIFDPEQPANVVWEGDISLKQFKLFTEDAGGMWIHADQKGIDRQTWSHWFMKAYPATLVTAEG